jgi:3-deoxy-D-manno-octulosonic-acid transferase
VYGIPVIFGPVNQNSREAQLLKKSGGGIEVHNSTEIEQELIKFFKDDFYRRKIGTFASNVVLNNTGATQRTIESILPLLKKRNDEI